MLTSGPGAERRPIAIANPSAGRGRAGRALPHIFALLEATLGRLDTYVTTCAGEARQAAAAAADERRPLVVSIGGDGTLNEIVNGLLGGAGSGGADAPAHGAAAPSAASLLPALGIVATGTGGDYVRSFGVGKRPDDWLAVIAGGAERVVDAGLATFVGPDGAPTARYWANVLSAGIGGLVDRYSATAPGFLGGRVAYGQATLRAIFTCRRRRLLCRYEGADGSHGERRLDAHAVAICNGRTFGGGMNVAPMASLDDGLLDVIVFEPGTRWRMIRSFPTLYAGTHLDVPGVSHFTCRTLELVPAGPMKGRRPRAGLFPLDVDGDALGDVPLRVEVLPAALRVRAPST
jgi:diacylglycerol kinase (ATP)